MNHSSSISFINCPRCRNIHRTDLDAVVRATAVLNAVRAHNAVEPFVAVHFSVRVHIEKSELRERLRADLISVAVLRAGFQATTAGHTARVGVTLFGFFLADSRPRT